MGWSAQGHRLANGLRRHIRWNKAVERKLAFMREYEQIVRERNAEVQRKIEESAHALAIARAQNEAVEQSRRAQTVLEQRRAAERERIQAEAYAAAERREKRRSESSMEWACTVEDAEGDICYVVNESWRDHCYSCGAPRPRRYR